VITRETKKATRRAKRIAALLILVPITSALGTAPSNAVNLTTPTGATAFAVSGSATSITVDFRDSSNATTASLSGYTVNVFSVIGGVDTLVKSETNYVKLAAINGLSANTTYKVRVRAIAKTGHSSSGFSAFSNTATTKPYLATPAAPTASALSATTDSITVSYSNVSNANAYAIQVYLASDNSLVGSLRNNFVSGSTIANLSENTEYVLKLTASATSGAYAATTSAFSSAVRTNSAPQVPSISAEPQSMNINSGQSATFTIGASVSDSGALTYQWQVATETGSFSDLSGATQATLELTNVSFARNLYRYQVVVTNTLNGMTRSTTSGIATLTVAISRDNSLSALTITPGTTSVPFQPSTTNYSLSISSTVTAVFVNASTLSSFASIRLNGSTLARNEPTSVAVDSNSQSQVITISVTAEDLSTKDYLIAVKRVITGTPSTLRLPNATPAPSTSPVQTTTQRIQTSSLSELPRINAPGGLSVPSGTVGTTVTINGTGFNSVLSVKLNGINIKPSDASLITPTSITVTIPVGARSGALVVTTSKGSVSTPRFTVT